MHQNVALSRSRNHLIPKRFWSWESSFGKRIRNHDKGDENPGGGRYIFFLKTSFQKLGHVPTWFLTNFLHKPVFCSNEGHGCLLPFILSLFWTYDNDEMKDTSTKITYSIVNPTKPRGWNTTQHSEQNIPTKQIKYKNNMLMPLPLSKERNVLLPLPHGKARFMRWLCNGS